MFVDMQDAEEMYECCANCRHYKDSVCRLLPPPLGGRELINPGEWCSLFNIEVNDT